MKAKRYILMTILSLFCCVSIANGATSSTQPSKLDKTVYQFEVVDINGQKTKLELYRNKVLLIVNTASQCGYTPQYKGLQKIYTKYKSRGFLVLGFPSNDFGGQEPGKNKEIKNFCELNYKVTFPLFSKVVVSGSGKIPLFKFLTEDAEGKIAGPIEWNFEKFLIGRDGRLIDRYKSGVDPESQGVLQGIETALGK